MNITGILRKYGIHLKDSLGQNFIKDEKILSRIVKDSGITDDATVIEIGIGLGTLTLKLAEKAKKVIGFEIDRRFEQIHEELLGGKNIQIVYGDFLKADLENYDSQPLFYVANIPYYITSPILEKILFEGPKFEAAILMVQKEYAERLLAKPSSKSYGALTIIIGAFTTVRKLFDVSRKAFFPVPAVDSSVVKLVMREQLLVPLNEKRKFRNFVKLAFSHRRKKLKNNLKPIIDNPEEFLRSMGFSANVRAEELSVENFVKLYEASKRWSKNGRKTSGNHC